jgi:hypothetical protein
MGIVRNVHITTAFKRIFTIPFPLYNPSEEKRIIGSQHYQNSLSQQR